MYTAHHLIWSSNNNTNIEQPCPNKLQEHPLENVKICRGQGIYPQHTMKYYFAIFAKVDIEHVTKKKLMRVRVIYAKRHLSRKNLDMHVENNVLTIKFIYIVNKDNLPQTCEGEGSTFARGFQ